MSFINPKRIVFENTGDIIDYVSKGLPPSKKNFEMVITKVKFPNINDSGQGNGNSVYIPRRLFDDCDQATLEESLTRVYKNRIHNRNIILTIAGIAALTLVAGSVKSHMKHKDDDINMDLDTQSFGTGLSLDDCDVVIL